MMVPITPLFKYILQSNSLLNVYASFCAKCSFCLPHFTIFMDWLTVKDQQSKSIANMMSAAWHTILIGLRRTHCSKAPPSGRKIAQVEADNGISNFISRFHATLTVICRFNRVVCSYFDNWFIVVVFFFFFFKELGRSCTFFHITFPQNALMHSLTATTQLQVLNREDRIRQRLRRLGRDSLDPVTAPSTWSHRDS